MRDFRLTPDRVIYHCPHCRIDAPLLPEQVEEWVEEHNHEGGEQK